MGYTTFVLRDGEPISFEIDAIHGPQPVSKLGDAIEKSLKSVEKSLHTIRDFAEVIITEMRAGLASAGPDSVELTFGIKLSAELGGFVVAKAGGEAHYEVKLKWNSVRSTTVEEANARSGNNPDSPAD
jgi:Trypsin-co-occurring domain 1